MAWRAHGNNNTELVENLADYGVIKFQKVKDVMLHFHFFSLFVFHLNTYNLYHAVPKMATPNNSQKVSYKNRSGLERGDPSNSKSGKGDTAGGKGSTGDMKDIKDQLSELNALYSELLRRIDQIAGLVTRVDELESQVFDLSAENEA